ncbi:uncharacterized protein LOC109613963 [Musca domestica]|uniref:Uncharacterized protein LOC109613963 n=1 Tax=Musca domestica TaxID=7370 RepID=A0A9J7IIX7_MUSDO|nr:uncharacterized protein LOC109613963 [Musca domestica]
MAAQCSCPVETTTTYHEQYQQLEKTKPIKIHAKPIGLDQELISGHIGNNLYPHVKPPNSKVWPGMLKESEEYQAFLARLEKSRKEIFNLYYKSPPVQQMVIQDMFRNLSKSTYQCIYSPHVYVPRKESLRAKMVDSSDVNMPYQETTYRTFYRDIQELEKFKDLLIATITNRERLELKQELRGIYKCGRSTYNDSIAKPAAIYAKPTRWPAPIDRYTLRRS